MILVNGKAREDVPVTDRGLAYGDGLFETLAVQGGEPGHWQRHMTRMAAGCARLDLPMPDPALWLAEARTVLASGTHSALKLMLTRGAGPRGYRPPPSPEPTRILMALDIPAHPAAWREEGVHVRVCQARLARNPLLAGIKHLNRLEQVLARNEWQDGFQEGIMLDTEDHVVEGTMSNLFLIRGGTLHTPLLDQCGVAGVTRARVMACALGLGIPVQEGRYGLDDLFGADGLLLTNTLIGLWPVRALEGRPLPVSPLAGLLQRALDGDGP
jgi:4-amino-4-deoxychorismate lyase